MDDLLREFLTETNESLDTVDVELVRFEQEPNNAKILDNIFRLVHTIKGTCGFLGLPRLEALAHAAETLMGKFRDGMPVTGEAVTLILSTIDRLKEMLGGLEQNEAEPEGSDDDLIGELERMAIEGTVAAAEAKSRGLPRPAARLLRRRWSGRCVRAKFRSTISNARSAKPRPSPHRRRKPSRRRSRSRNPPRPSASSPAKTRTQVDKVANQSIRVNVDTLEHLMTMVSELVLTRNQLLEIARRHEDSEFKVPLQRLSNVTAELQEGVMKTRMQPIGNAWQKLPRIVRDLASELSKQIELEMHGAETELDRQVLDLIKDPLTHMVRNSADHGLETPEERRAAGKPEKGTIRLSAYHEGGHIIIEIADDGRGLEHRAHQGRRRSRSGLATEAELEKMTEAQIHKFIFARRLLDRREGDQRLRPRRRHGRGAQQYRSDRRHHRREVGARRGLELHHQDSADARDRLGADRRGRRRALRDPAARGDRARARAGQFRAPHRAHQGHAGPAAAQQAAAADRPEKLLKMDDGAGSEPENGFIVVTQVGSQTFGIVVDGVFHTEEIVVKPMSTKLRHIAMFSGNTILGDGSVIMIIDPNGIAQAVGSAGAQAPTTMADAQQARARSTRPSRCWCSAPARTQPKAVPLVAGHAARRDRLQARSSSRTAATWCSTAAS